MEKLFLMILLLVAGYCIKAQPDCGIPYSPENLRPDTITVYYFQDTLVPVSHIRKARATSNVSFQADHYRFIWMPAGAKNIEAFILSGLMGMPGTAIDGRRFCSVFEKAHTVVVLRRKHKIQFVFYEPGKGSHIYVADGIKLKKRDEVFKEIIRCLTEGYFFCCLIACSRSLHAPPLYTFL